MKLVHFHLPGEGGIWGLAADDTVHPLATDRAAGEAFLAAMLQLPDPARTLIQTFDAVSQRPGFPLTELMEAVPDPSTPHLLAPLDRQEVWAAGVTYLRSKVARMEESEGAARFYDMVYEAERPELFYKGAASRVSGPNAQVRIRRDATWNVPEPEFALLVSREGRIVGYTIGNDMSSRDIEGANPLYLPQAKVYRQACGLGPVIWLDPEPPEHRELEIAISIRRDDAEAFSGQTSSTQMKRNFTELVAWLGRDNLFPHGVFLLTGTGLVPGEEFTLQGGDEVAITVPEIGTLRNTVVQAA